MSVCVRDPWTYKENVCERPFSGDKKRRFGMASRGQYSTIVRQSVSEGCSVSATECVATNKEVDVRGKTKSNLATFTFITICGKTRGLLLGQSMLLKGWSSKQVIKCAWLTSIAKYTKDSAQRLAIYLVYRYVVHYKDSVLM